jgi:flagellar hook-basal body complex protein FliE
MATPAAAANAYTSLARLTSGGTNLTKSLGQEAGGESFGATLSNVLSSVEQAGRKADSQAQAMAAGKANIVDVVTAVAETEVAVEAIVAVRDRVIQAYEEIMRMPI